MTALGIAQAVVRAAARLVPRWQRTDWEREWHTELQHHARAANGSPASVVTRSTGAVADAAALRNHAMQWDLLWSDTRFAWRNVMRRPAFTALVVLTLALGIGVNSAVFALLDGVLLRPLPYREPSRLVFMWQTLPSKDVFELEPTPFDYAAWKALRGIESLALVIGDAVTIATADDPERVRGARVSASLMPMLGIGPQLGRAFNADEDSNAAAPVAILGDGLWRRRFAADPRAVGRDIRVNGVAHTVVGVMPPGARLPGHLAGNSEIWLPMRMTPAERDTQVSHNYTVVGRLAAGASFDAASKEIEAFGERMAVEHPDSHGSLGARLTLVEEQTVRVIKPTLLVVSGGVLLLLLVACANAVTLLVARAATRHHETAVRTALGASTSRLLSLAIVESVIYAVLGGLAGLALGGWTLNLLLPLFAGSLPPGAAIDLNARVAVFTAGLSAVLGLAFGAVVAAHRPGRLVDALKSSTRSSTGGRSVARTRSALVVTQVALAVVLLAAAGLMLESVARLSRVSPGFDADHVLSFRLALAGPSYSAPPQRAAFVNELTSRLAASPGISAAAVVSSIPFGGTRGANSVEIEGRPVVRGELVIIDQRHVTPGYFAAMRIPVIEGRGLLDTDDAQAEPVTVVNRTMARKYWPGSSAVDKRVRLAVGSRAAGWLRVVGVVDDVRHISLSREYVPEMYVPYSQTSVVSFTVVMQTPGEPSSAAPAARSILRALDPNLPLFDVRSMADRIAGSFAQTRGTMLLLTITAILAAALASVAIYGSIWYAVGQRIPELGIRLALGASRGSVCASVMVRALGLSAIDAFAGSGVALAAGPLLKGLLFETPATDPATFALVILGVLCLTALASVVPARRAMSVDPMIALRND